MTLCHINLKHKQLQENYMAEEVKPLTKTQIIATLAERSGLDKKDVITLLETLTALAYSETKKSGKFTLPGFGILKLVQRAARTGRNPATGETIQIPAKTAVKFTVNKAAKDAISGVKK